jgi:hypothetical protein
VPYRKDMALRRNRWILLRILLAACLLSLASASTPMLSPTAQACSIAAPTETFSFVGVARSRIMLKVQGENITYRWTFTVKSWTANSAGVKPVKAGAKMSLTVLEPNPKVTNRTSCGDEAITVKFKKGATYQVGAAKFGGTWLVESYAGQLSAV